MAVLTNKGNIQERTVGTIQKLKLVLADIQGMTSGTAATSWTYTLPNGSTQSVGIPYSTGDRLGDVFYQLITPFAGGSNTAMKIVVGYKGATATTANTFVASTEILASGYVSYSSGTGTWYSTVEAGNISVTFTATGDTLANLTAGEIDIYVTQCYATDLYL